MFGFNKQDVRLAVNLFKMNVRDRYLGSSLGSYWAIVNPLLMLAIFTFVFGFIFKIRLPGSDSTLAYAVWLISGYGPWIATNEAIMASSISVTGAVGIVKNMAFKSELLPIAAAFVGLISLVVSFCFLLILMIFDGNYPTWHIFLLPIVVGAHFFIMISIGIWLSAINVFVRDLTQTLPTLLTIVLYLTPIFYAFESMPKFIQQISFINPLYQIADSYRRILVGHQLPNLFGIAYLFSLSFVIFFFGLRAFRRVKGNFDSAM